MRRRSSVWRLVGASTAAALIALCLLALAWRAEGGRWFVVRTPSMGRAAPVGTLLLTKPTTISAVHVGDLITFRAPTSGVVYTHRVVETGPAGVHTRGDINAVTDPWVVTSRDLVGKVAYRWWGCGWLLRGLPLLMLCFAVLWLVTAYFGDLWRSPMRVVGAALSTAGVAAYLRPWVGIERLTTTVGPDGPVLRVVSVGVLPISATPEHGTSTGRLVNGQVADVAFSRGDANGAYNLSAHLNLPLGWWVAIVIACLAPLLWTVIVGLEPVTPEPLEVSDADAESLVG